MRDSRAVTRNEGSEIARLRVNLLQQIKEAQAVVNPPPLLPMSAYAEYGSPTAPAPGGARPTQPDTDAMAAAVITREQNKMLAFVTDPRFSETPVGSFGTHPVMAPRPPRAAPLGARPNSLATWPPLLEINVVSTIDHFALVSACTTIRMSMTGSPDQVLDPRVIESRLSSLLGFKMGGPCHGVQRCRDLASLRRGGWKLCCQ